MSDWKPEVGKEAMWDAERMTVLAIDDTVAWLGASGRRHFTVRVCDLRPVKRTAEELCVAAMEQYATAICRQGALTDFYRQDEFREAVLPIIEEAMRSGA